MSEASRRGRRNRRAGAAREHGVADWYEDRGYVVGFKRRRAGEQGFDLVAAKPGDVVLVEVKSSPTPFGSFPPAARRRLLERAKAAGARAELAHWPYDNRGVKSLRIYKPAEWPGGGDE